VLNCLCNEGDSRSTAAKPKNRAQNHETDQQATYCLQKHSKERQRKPDTHPTPNQKLLHVPKDKNKNKNKTILRES